MPYNKVKINVAGTSYVVNTQDSEEQVLSLAKKLDDDMNEILEKTPSASITARAVLCALTYLDDLDKANKGADNMRLQQYLEDAMSARSEAEKVKVELEKLKVDIEYLKAQRENNGK